MEKLAAEANEMLSSGEISRPCNISPQNHQSHISINKLKENLQVTGAIFKTGCQDEPTKTNNSFNYRQMRGTTKPPTPLRRRKVHRR